MRKKLFNKLSLMEIGVISTITLCCIGGVAAYAITTNSADKPQNGNTVWTEVPIIEGSYKVLPTYFNFDLDNLITEADYIFCGTVVERKEYEVSWTDDNGEQWGPYPSSVIEVKINKDYYGGSHTEGDTIKVYTPESLSADIEGTLQLKENNEYIFITRNLDDAFIAEKAMNAPDDKFEQENHADVYITNSRDNIISISKEGIVAYREFFGKDFVELRDTASNQLNSVDSVITNDIVESNDYIILDKADFEIIFEDIISSRKNISLVTNPTE